MPQLVADVLVAAEHHHGIERQRGRAVQADVPLEQLVTVLCDHVGEQLRPNERPMDDGEHTHHAAGLVVPVSREDDTAVV